MAAGLLSRDPRAQDAVLHALAEVNAARTGFRGALDIDDDTDPGLVLFALATLAALLADAADRAGGDGTAGEVLTRIYMAVSPTEEENRG
jgi:hypothetical protein